MIRDITLGQYYPTDSVLHRLDPRVKLVGTLVYVVSLFLFQSFTGYIVATVFLVSMIIIAWILIHYTDSTVPWCDSFTTALSIIGMWMLARKYLEQWWVWMVVDVVCVGLYFYKELYFTSALYALYAIIAVFGWVNWKKIMQQQ